MPAAIRITIKALVALAAACGIVLAIVWPWPAPEVDWRTQVNAALARQDCAAVVRVVDVADDAGIREALQLRADLAGKGQCFDAKDVPPRDEFQVYLDYEARTKTTGEMIALIYNLDENDLGSWTNFYVTQMLLLCGMPYNTLLSADNAALSQDLVAQPSFLMSLHRRRRDVCTGELRRLAAQLIDTATPASREVALELLGWKPLSRDAQSVLLFAKLVLQQEFVTRAGSRWPSLSESDRAGALIELRRVAQDGDEEAIRMMIAVLHDGRVVMRDDAEAYFWLLRLRRGGKTYDPTAAAAIETALTDADRKDIAEREEFMAIKPLKPSS